ncbi:hypothetical protein [Delftia tsuruhatensis]|uniref:hypothetical protein n=1 Tax=Delftia tsuruhatensis TaxID=180282 RepID=UPI00128CCD31|nr:hypothetical protein [Delftia tsuruhatensis]
MAKSAGQILEDVRANTRHAVAFGVFLPQAIADAVLVLGAKQLLEQQGTTAGATIESLKNRQSTPRQQRCSVG